MYESLNTRTYGVYDDLLRRDHEWIEDAIQAARVFNFAFAEHRLSYVSADLRRMPLTSDVAQLNDFVNRAYWAADNMSLPLHDRVREIEINGDAALNLIDQMLAYPNPPPPAQIPLAQTYGFPYSMTTQRVYLNANVSFVNGLFLTVDQGALHIFDFKIVYRNGSFVGYRDIFVDFGRSATLNRPFDLFDVAFVEITAASNSYYPYSTLSIYSR